MKCIVAHLFAALAEEYMKKRLRWARENVHWTDEQQSSVIWSEESRLTFTGNDGGVRVIKKFGKRCDAKYIVLTKKYNNDRVVICSCFYAKFFGPLVLVDGRVNQDKYRHFNPTNLPLIQDKVASKMTGAVYSKFLVILAVMLDGWKETYQIRSFEYWPT